MKKILSMILIALLALSLAGCGKKSAATDDALDISGYYELKSLTSASGTETTDEDIQMLKQLGIIASLECASDGTAVLDLFGDRIDLTYDLDKMIFVIDGQEASFTYEDGDIIMVDGEDSLTFTPAEKGQ